MAEVKIDTKNLKRSFAESIKKIMTDTQVLLDVGQATVDMTKGYIRTGKNIKTGERFPALKESTIESKRQLAKHNKTHDTYVDGLSNATFTGQLIDSLGVVSIDKANSSVRINFRDDKNRKPYKTSEFNENKKVEKNSTIAKYLTDRGWKFFGDNKKLHNVINRIVRTYLFKELKKIYNNK
jgi:hypothetical protein